MASHEEDPGMVPRCDGDAAAAVRPSLLPPLSEFDDENTEIVGPKSKPVSFRLVWRACRRNWWQAFLLWGLGSVLLMALAFYKVKPTYDAFAAIRVEQGEQGMYAPELEPDRLRRVKETQVTLITSPTCSASR